MFTLIQMTNIDSSWIKNQVQSDNISLTNGVIFFKKKLQEKMELKNMVQ